MAPLIYKPRPKMHSWTPPSPPEPKRSYFYVWAVVGWLAVVAAGYRWLPVDWGVQEEDDASGAELPAAMPGSIAELGERSPRPRADAAATAPSAATTRPPRESKPESTEIVPCEEFTKATSVAPESRLPMHLGRSALDAFIGANDWAKPCRTKHRQTVHLCVAILDGSVRGLSLKTSRPNLTLENCLREQAKKLVLAPEATMRIVNTTFRL